MAPSVVPLSEVSPDLLRDFLARAGMTREVADWRYLDTEFNRGRNRGFAWLPRNRMEGMVGLIPFHVAGPGPLRVANWSSDWMLADPTSNPGMGILLLKRAIESSGELYALGGNKNTQKLLPRIATRTVPDAGLGFHLPLRAGALLSRIDRAVSGRLPKPKFLYMIPLRWRRESGGSPQVHTQPGLARQLEPLLDVRQEKGWYPCYDMPYLDWQIGRSPLLRCWTSFSPNAGERHAAAVFWRPRSSTDFWRLAVWWRGGHRDHLQAVIREVVAQIYQQGGMAVSAIVSRLDEEVQAALRSAGFLNLGSRRSLYICTSRNNDKAVQELRGISYLDSDLGYRF